MRIFKLSPLAIGCNITVLILLIGLVGLRAFSNSFFHGRFTATTEDVGFARKVPSKGSGDPPIFAYWISGTYGENREILRLLKAVYHPRNHYLLHLDAGAWNWQRIELALSVRSDPVFRAFGNVDVIGKAYAIDQTGPSALAATLHAAAILLRTSLDWDWFIPLSADDYPIVTQDDILHAFTSLPRDLNFIHHSGKDGWKEFQMMNQMIVDPNLYSSENTHTFDLKEMREFPDAFEIFKGSPRMILSRSLMDYCVHGSDNLPRKLLMYFTNVAFPLIAYFQTVVCNSPLFQNTTVNNDLRYFMWDPPPPGGPRYLGLDDYEGMVGSGAVFAGPFKEGDPVLQKVDEDVLRRPSDGVVPGKWCMGPPFLNQNRQGDSKEGLCSTWGSIDAVQPGPHGKNLKVFLKKLVAERVKLGQYCRPG